MTRILKLKIAVVQFPALLALISMAAAGQTLLVDTGPGSPSAPGQPAFGTGSTGCSPQPACQSNFQFLAGQFTLASAATLDSVQGFMFVGGPMSVAVKIYSNNANVPTNVRPGTAIYSQTYPLNNNGTYGWVVFPNYNPVLAAGTYWLAFEPQPGSSFQISMPGGAPTPLADYAFWVNGNNGYVNFAVFGTHAGLGMRISGTSTTQTLSFGSFARVMEQDTCPVAAPIDFTVGDLNVPLTYGLYFGTDGIQSARATFAPITLFGNTSTDLAPSVGAWSDSNLGNGGARALSMRTFQNQNATAQTLRVSAVLDGLFAPDNIGLPDGILLVAAGIHVVDAGTFSAALAASGKTAAQYLMDYYTFPSPQSSDPALAMSTLGSSLPGLLTDLVMPDLTGPVNNQVLTIPLNTPTFVLQPGQFFTVMFDLSTVGLTQGAACLNIPQGTGQVYFLDSLKPAANLFTDANGNPVAGIGGAGTAPVLPPSAANLTLAPPTASDIVGGTHTVTATATTSGGAPVPGVVAKFTVTAGPNAGAVGAGLTDSNGQASFTYTDKGGLGTDTIQANIGSVVSNNAQETWKPPACPLGQGYWKNHTRSWPAAALTLGTQSYSASELLAILQSPGHGDASEILAVELIAARLNIANGSDPHPISSVLSAADSLLAAFTGKLPYNVDPSSAPGQQMTQAAATLDSYNNGALTIGTCQ